MSAAYKFEQADLKKTETGDHCKGTYAQVHSVIDLVIYLVTEARRNQYALIHS